MSGLDIEKISALAAEVISVSRNTISVNLRFLNYAISMLKPEEYVGKIMTDGKKIYYDPIYILSAYKKAKEYTPRFFLHSLLHCVFRHWFVSDDINKELWDLSCDIAVECIINELNIACVNIPQKTDQMAAAAKLKNKTKYLTAEKIYSYFQTKKIPINELDTLRNIFSFDEHSIWYFAGNADNDTSENDDSDENQDRPKKSKNSKNNRSDSDKNQDNHNSETSKDRDGISAALGEQWKNVSEQIQTDLETFSKRIGDESGTMMQNLAAVNREKYDYSAFLRKFSVMGEVMKVNDDEFDYIFYSYGLKLFDNMPLIEPLEYKETKRIKEFVIAIDTSGSVEGELVQLFLQKTYNILMQEESFFTKINVHIIQCDVDVQEDAKITSQKEFDEYIKTMKLRGFGGTDFRPVFRYVNDLIRDHEFINLKGMIYFTDGFGLFPEHKPDYQTAFIFIDDEYNNPDVPPWAIKLILQREEI